MNIIIVLGQEIRKVLQRQVSQVSEKSESEDPESAKKQKHVR